MSFKEKTKEGCTWDDFVRNRSKRSQNGRLFMLFTVFAVLFAGLICRLWELQIVNGQNYICNYELKITKTVRDRNTRGMIYDCNGEVLAYNRLVYTVTMTDTGEYHSERERQLALNGMIYRVLKRLNKNNETVNNELKIKRGADGKYEYTVSGKALGRFKADVFGRADPNDMPQEESNMDAGDLVKLLSSNGKFALYGEGKTAYSDRERQEYGLPQEYSNEELLAMIGIRYMLSLHSYKKYVPILVARDVSEDTIAFILENSQSLTGVSVGTDLDRVYAKGEAFSHILGYTGKISAEEMERSFGLGKDYTVDSVVGKAGLELYLEEYLQGIDGERQITVNNVGKVIGDDTIIRETVNGNDVRLSVDSDLQLAVYRILEQNLAGILASNLIDAKKFDKSQVPDTSLIRIPVYDVYQAFLDNDVISLENLYRPDATQLEQSLADVLERKRQETKAAFWAECLAKDTEYTCLTEEMQEYAAYAVDKMGVLEEESVDTEDDIYQKWKHKEGISVKELLIHAVQSGWISEEFMESMQGYLTADETYELLAEKVAEKLADDSEFGKMLFWRLLLAESIAERDICRLLYDQKVLTDTDGDYDQLVSGEMDAFSFIKKKIEHLEITPAQLALDPCSASAVIVQPNTGKVLALVSYPGYDNNRLANQMDMGYYNRLLDDKSLPLYNRATQQLTAPGSTFKPITIIAGLQEGVISPGSAMLCDGVFDKVEPSLKCWKHSGHGTVENAPTSLQLSCNDYMCEIAYRMGGGESAEYTDSTSLKCLQKYTRLFHLDKKSGVEITESNPHVTDAYGIPSAIGQGTHNYATVQLAKYISAIALGGEIYSLSLLKGDTDTDTVPEGRVDLPDAVWDTVHAGMLQFAQNNAVLKDMQLSIAGKTGTAQESKNRPDHALFVGYAPADAPEIAVAVRIANGYGSSNATAVGKSIFNYYFGLKDQEQIITGEASQAFNTRTD